MINEVIICSVMSSLC